MNFSIGFAIVPPSFTIFPLPSIISPLPSVSNILVFFKVSTSVAANPDTVIVLGFSVSPLTK